jgi:hypothetical protein
MGLPIGVTQPFFIALIICLPTPSLPSPFYPDIFCLLKLTHPGKGGKSMRKANNNTMNINGDFLGQSR